jgi:hypothetical protein
MELNKLEKYKKEFKQLSQNIESLQSYLKNQAVAGIEMFTAYQLSIQTGINETAAMFILSLAEKEHLITKKYSVFSDDDTLIAEFDTSEEIPQKIINSGTGKEVNRDHFYVQISYELENE